jgi:hypothetical protein
MAEHQGLLASYIEHLEARTRAQRGTRVPIPNAISHHCSEQPRECLDLVLTALERAETSRTVEAIGDGLLESLLNEHADRISQDVADHLRTNGRFRQAFASGTHSSVDPTIMEDWLAVFQDLGTTKAAERKSLRKA